MRRAVRALPVLSVLLGLSPGISVCKAHDLDYAVATATFRMDGSYEIQVAFHIAAFVLETEPGDLSLEAWTQLRDMSDEEWTTRIDYARGQFGERLRIAFGEVVVEPDSILFPGPELLREDGLTLTPRRAPPVQIQGTLPAGAEDFTVTFPYQAGIVWLEVNAPEGPPAGQFIGAGRESMPLPIIVGGAGMEVRRPGWAALFWTYFLLGFEHILPRGLDHVLFVLGLFLLCSRWGALLTQVTAFTVAHSVTLALSFYQIVSLPPFVVEPLIALSITVVAVENVLTSRMHPWRTALVFAFGLLHGLGFASVLGNLLAPGRETAIALASFNIGIEAGQLAVILLAFLAVGHFQSRDWYRSRVSIPASCCIALVGLFWTVERIFLR